MAVASRSDRSPSWPKIPFAVIRSMSEMIPLRRAIWRSSSARRTATLAPLALRSTASLRPRCPSGSGARLPSPASSLTRGFSTLGTGFSGSARAIRSRRSSIWAISVTGPCSVVDRTIVNAADRNSSAANTPR